MRLDIRRGIQLLTGRDPEAGRKIADLDAVGDAPPQPASAQPAAPQPAAPPAPSSALRPAAPALAASQADASDAPLPDASEADWGELLVRLLASAPEDVAQKLVGCLDREVITKALERRNDPYLKVALMLIAKK
ncbi:MAG: hypothetical protein AT707_02960 [Pyrobaculum sp. JCHS_4]|jgi:hypothetical protein|nr:MAG: hypothetical protein AT707_02960 [Pyrobaculum sp. JCHS_4]